MRFDNRFIAAAAMATVMAASALATPVGPRGFDISKFGYRAKTASRTINFERIKTIEKINAKLRAAEGMTVVPNISFESSNGVGDLDGPNGELWFYTASFTNKTIHHEYYDEQVLLEYRFDIYDSNAQLVGSVNDKVRYEENEIRTVQCDIVPVITKNFFNDDDKYELIVGFAINRQMTYEDGTTGWMPNAYRNVIYSLDGEKETIGVEDPMSGAEVMKEFDKPVYQIEGSLGDVLDASVNGKEDIYLTFYEEELPEYSDDDIESGDNGPTVSDDFWQNLVSAHITLRICGKVGADGKMPELQKIEIPILAMPGDQENTPFMISLRNGDDAYYMTQYYKEVFYNRYNSATDDLTMREHNSLVIDLYSVKDGTVTKAHSTEIPFVMDSKDRLLFSFHSTGDFRYAEDINFNENGEPTYFITKNNYFADEHSEMSFYHYGKDGKKLNNIFENADSHMPMSAVAGFEPQEMFVTYFNGEYIFHFVDLLTGTEKTAFSCYLETDPDSDPDMMTSNIDRTKVGDSYQYAVEMRTPSVDENDNSILRISWLDANGKFIKMDEVNMGQFVVYAQSYIDGYTLQPDMFLTDEPNEYMMLIKRGVDANTMREDLLIAQAMNPSAPEGRDVLLLTADERGALATINPYTMLEKPMLHVYYYDQPSGTMAMDIYNLPFDTNAIEEIEGADSGNLLTFDGENIYADGMEISIYNLGGMMERKGADKVSVNGLESGIYIAVAGREVRKFMVK